MLALLLNTTGYRLLGLLHVLAVICAFGPLLIYPSMQRAGAGQAVARLHLRLALPAMTLVWVLGMGLVGMSDDVWELTQTWILLSLIGWVILMLVSWFLIRPALTDTERDGTQSHGVGHRRHAPAAGGDPLPDDLQARHLTPA